MTTVKVVPWTWRNGSVHLEVRLASFFHNDDNSLVTHLDGGTQRFVTACGREWFGVTSSSGLGPAQRISCQECRDILTHPDTKFVADQPSRAES